jgi:hypothetical protein
MPEPPAQGPLDRRDSTGSISQPEPFLAVSAEKSIDPMRRNCFPELTPRCPVTAADAFQAAERVMPGHKGKRRRILAQYGMRSAIGRQDIQQPDHFPGGCLSSSVIEAA